MGKLWFVAGGANDSGPRQMKIYFHIVLLVFSVQPHPTSPSSKQRINQ